jgi:hypothetical protein
MANIARQKAETLPEGDERDRLLRKADQSERSAAMEEWLSTPGLPLPE